MAKAAKFTADFGKTAEDYARHRAGYPDWLFERLMRRGLARPGMRALDLATGTGYLGRGLAQRGLIVTGLDVSPEMIAAAKALDAAQGLRIDYAIAKVEETGLPAASFDLVTAATCWHWFDRDKASAEVLRLLKPGGWLVMEISGAIAGRVQQLLSDWKDVQITNDLQGIARVASARKA